MNHVFQITEQATQVELEEYRQHLREAKRHELHHVGPSTMFERPDPYLGHDPSKLRPISKELMYHARIEDFVVPLIVSEADWTAFRTTVLKHFVGADISVFSRDRDIYRGLPFHVFSQVDASTKFLSPEAVERLHNDFVNVASDDAAKEFLSLRHPDFPRSERLRHIYYRLENIVKAAMLRDGLLLIT